jgi:cellulose synthase/poly-beta-1,6-N-acetylglucosamine synthase-like glycosyltransferase
MIRSKLNQTITFDTKVSIIIPVRNESQNILHILNDLKKQDYPSHLLEVIIIDDHSTDDTAEQVRSYAMPNLKLIRLNEKEALNSYKKKAISVAIKDSNAELIVTTDGDCRMGEKWISTIVNFYKTNDLKFISAPVSFHNEKNLFEKIQTIEFQYLIGVGAGSINNGFPNTCNGANLAYTRDVFNELDGFKGIDDIASGDDELFLHKVARKYPAQISFLKHRDAIVYTEAKRNFKEFLQQRKRWASKSMKYTDKRIVMMVSLIFLYNFSLPVNTILGFIDPAFWKILCVQLILKVFADGFFIISTLRFFRKQSFAIYIPIVMFLYTIYILAMGFYSNFGNTYHWKGREVR